MLKTRPGPQALARPSQAYAIPATDVTEAVLFRFADYNADFAHSERYRHIFCGAQQGPVAYCPNCDRPLTQLLVLDTDDPRLQMTEWDRNLPLLFCWRCALAHTALFVDYQGNSAYAVEGRRKRREQEAHWYTQTGRIQTTRLHLTDGTAYADLVPFYYRVNSDRTITLLQYRKGPATPEWPYPNYPDAFPEARARLFRLTEEVQDAMRALHLGEEADYLNDEDEWPDFPDLDYILGHDEWHQVGGESYNCYGWHTMPCPLCSGPMPFLAHIVDKCADPRGFVGGRDWDVLFHACTKCFVLGAFSRGS